MTYPGVIFWVLVFAAMVSRGPAMIYLYFVTWSLGTLAVIPPQMAGGNFTPAWVVAAFMAIQIMFQIGWRRYVAVLLDPGRFGFLTLCTAYSVISAIFFPLLFRGQVLVISMRLLNGAGETPLVPDAANFSQALYFVLTTIGVVNVYFVCLDPLKRRQTLNAFAWGAVTAVVTGLIDLVASNSGLGKLLVPFRNAAYSLMLDNDAMNMHRVVGLMTEASAYASLCLPYLCLLALTPAYAAAPWRWWRVPLGATLLLMTYLSTSSGGYVGLGGLGLTMVGSAIINLFFKTPGASLGLVSLIVGAFAIAGLALVAPQIEDTVYHVIDVMVLHKTTSESYLERSNWNRVAMNAFVATKGLGAGMGSARASSWVVSLLSNIGLPGTLTLVIFMLQAFFSRAPDPKDRSLARAAKLALFPSLLIVSLSGTAAGFGLAAAFFFGLMCAVAWPERSWP